MFVADIDQIDPDVAIMIAVSDPAIVSEKCMFMFISNVTFYFLFSAVVMIAVSDPTIVSEKCIFMFISNVMFYFLFSVLGHDQKHK